MRNTESRRVGCAGHFADMETEARAAGKVIFTLKWRLNDRWEGRNFEVRLDPVHQEMAARLRPPPRTRHLKEEKRIVATCNRKPKYSRKEE